VFGYIKRLIYTLTWSNQPAWLSPPLRKTRLRRGKYVTRVWADKNLRIDKTQRTYLGLGDVDISYIRNRNDVTLIAPIHKVSATDCRDHLVKSLSIPPIREVQNSNVSGHIFQLDLAITEMSPGATLFRGFDFPIFLLGLGHAYVQVEGIVTDVKSDLPSVKFVERRRHSGFTAREDWSLIKDKLTFEKSMVGTLLSEAPYNILSELNALFVPQ